MKKSKTKAITLNDRLNALCAYLKTKAFGWAFIWTGRLIGPLCLLKK